MALAIFRNVVTYGINNEKISANNLWKVFDAQDINQKIFRAHCNCVFLSMATVHNQKYNSTAYQSPFRIQKRNLYKSPWKALCCFLFR